MKKITNTSFQSYFLQLWCNGVSREYFIRPKRFVVVEEGANSSILENLINRRVLKVEYISSKNPVKETQKKK